LGKLHQEFDEDTKAIACLEKAYELDPFDLDSLLYLGSSCSNMYNKLEGMKYLVKWLMYNTEYNTDIHVDESLLNITDEFELRPALKELLARCLDKNPRDVGLLSAAGITSF